MHVEKKEEDALKLMERYINLFKKLNGNCCCFCVYSVRYHHRHLHYRIETFKITLPLA